jgi:CubicO group peptidase (beta-lactamase class C family)
MLGRRSFKALLLIFLCAVLWGPAAARAQVKATAEKAPVEITREMVERWADREVAEIVRTNGASAAGAAVVAKGSVLLSKSYGWFDPVKKIPIDPLDQFDVGSVTKTFVSLVIARLQAEGKIRSLDDPVNKYLTRVQLPRYDGREATIRQLATHSAGLESPGFGLSAGDQTTVPAPSEYMRRKMIKIVRTPGFKSVYANWGPPLLGAMAEDITGERFDRLIERILLRPLGMTATALSYDPTGGPHLVYAGVTAGGPFRYAPRTPNTPLAAPAGSIQTTPDDMARYMNALLGHAPEVLSPEILAVQRSPMMINYPGLSSLGLGVFLDSWNGTTIIQHSGLIAGYLCTMLVVPSRDFGIFVVYAGGRGAFGEGPGDSGQVADKLLIEVLGPAVPLPSHPTSDPRALTGRYWLELRAHSTPEVLFGMNRITVVEEAPGGGLQIGGEAGPKETFIEVAPGLFQGPAKDGRRPSLYGFEPGRLLINDIYSTKVSGFGDPRNIKRIGLILFCIALLGFLGIVIRGWRRVPPLATALAAAAAGYSIAWPLLMKINIDLDLFLGRAWRFRVGTISAWVLLIAGVAGLFAAISTWKRSNNERRRGLKAGLGLLVALASLGLAWMASSVHFFSGL